MKFTVNRQSDNTVLLLSGRLDSMTAPGFENQIDEFIVQPSGNLIIDFSELDYISSAGLRVILNTAKSFNASQWRFSVCSMQDHIREVFEISGFDNFIAIYNSVAECVENKE